MKLTEKKVDGKVVYDGKILKLEVDEVELADGSHSMRECVRHNGGAAVLCVCDEKVLLVKQFRYLYNRGLYEIPAGKLEKGESPEIAAARELEEETGILAETLVPYLNIYPTPGYTDEIIRVFFTDKFTVTQKKPDEGEFVTSEFIPLQEVMEMIENGVLCDAKTVAAVYKYAFTLKK